MYVLITLRHIYNDKKSEISVRGTGKSTGNKNNLVQYMTSEEKKWAKINLGERYLEALGHFCNLFQALKISLAASSRHSR
jgi:hypothetical protein